MMPDTPQALLLHCSHPPGATALAAIDAALTFAAFEQDIQLLFSGPGVLQLLQSQSNDPASGKNIAKLLTSLPLYGVETLYADADALIGLGLEDAELISGVQCLEAQEVDAMLQNNRAILSF